MLLSNGAPQFLGAAGASEGSGGSSSGGSGGGGGGGGGSGGSSGSAFNPQGEAGEQPYEHLTAGKRWPTPRISPFATSPATSQSFPRRLAAPPFTAAAFPDLWGASGASLSVLGGMCWRDTCGRPPSPSPSPWPSPSPPSPLAVRRRAGFCLGWRARAAWVGGGGGGLVLKSWAAPPFLQTGRRFLPPAPGEGGGAGRGRPGSPGSGRWRESLRGAAAAAERRALQWRGILRVCVSCCRNGLRRRSGAGNTAICRYQLLTSSRAHYWVRWPA